MKFIRDPTELEHFIKFKTQTTKSFGNRRLRFIVQITMSILLDRVGHFMNFGRHRFHSIIYKIKKKKMCRNSHQCFKFKFGRRL